MSLLRAAPEIELRSLEVPVFDDIQGFKAEAPYLERATRAVTELGLIKPTEAPPMERASGRLEAWSENREVVVLRLLEIAEELDKINKDCNIATVVSSSVGIAGGAAIIGGMILFPPAAIGGLVVGGVAAASNITTNVVKIVMIKKRANEVLELVRKDAELYDAYHVHAEELKEMEGFDVGDGAESTFGDKDASPDERKHAGGIDADIALGVGAATATGVSAAGARAALIETSRLAPAVAKGVVHGAAGIGIAIDLLTLILSAKDLKNGKSLDYADKLRTLARDLKLSLYEETHKFVRAVMPE